MKQILQIAFLFVVAVAVYMGSKHLIIQHQIENEPLAGYDRDVNGIRDDLDAVVNYLGKDSEKIHAALTQVVKAMQKTLVDAKDAEKSVQNYQEFIAGVDCLFSFDRHEQRAGKAIAALKDRMLNNETRKMADIEFRSHLAGVEQEPTPWEERRSKCKFDADALEN